MSVFFLFLLVDITLFAANMLKFIDGGWVPLVLAAAIFTAMWTWLQGRLAVATRERENTLPIERRRRSVERVILEAFEDADCRWMNDLAGST